MTDREKNKLSMLIAVRDFISANETKLSTLPSFSPIREQFETVVDRLLSISVDQRSNREGVALDKAQIKEELIRQAFDISKKLAAMAQIAGNNTLKKEVNFSKSKFLNATDSDLRQDCELIWDRATTCQEELETFNVTVAMVEDFKTQLTAFVEAIPKPKNALKDRKLITGTLKTQFEEADAILKDKIDFLLETVQTGDIALYNAYRSARTMSKDYGSRKRAVNVKVTDNAGQPLAKVVATVDGSTITKKTSDKGGFQIDHISAGVYTFKFSTPGYKPATATVVVREGDMTKVNVVMESIFESVSV